MSGIMRFDFRLFGPRKGQTMVINGHHFVNGICTLVQSSDNMGYAAKVLAGYQAYARGTVEYDEALFREEAEDGTSDTDEDAGQRIDEEISSNVQSDGRRPSESEAVRRADDVGSEGTDGSSIGSDRGGHEDTRVPQFPEDDGYRPTEPASSIDRNLAAAVRKLDPENDSHWVMTGAHKGKPKLLAVEQTFGRSGLTRQDVEAALPGYTRDQAVDYALRF